MGTLFSVVGPSRGRMSFIPFAANPLSTLTESTNLEGQQQPWGETAGHGQRSTSSDTGYLHERDPGTKAPAFGSSHPGKAKPSFKIRKGAPG